MFQLENLYLKVTQLKLKMLAKRRLHQKINLSVQTGISTNMFQKESITLKVIPLNLKTLQRVKL